MKKQRKYQPWLTPSGVERPLEELKQLSKTWEQKTWNEYLHWLESGRKDKLISSDFYLSQCETLEKSIFEEFGYQNYLADQNLCEQLLSKLAKSEAQVLKLIYLEGKTQKEIAALFRRSDRRISQIKLNALAALKWVLLGERLESQRIVEGDQSYNSKPEDSIWFKKLRSTIKEDRSYHCDSYFNELLNHPNPILKDIFKQLSERQLKIIYLKYFCGKNTSEVARSLSIGLNVVEQISDATVFKIKSLLTQTLNNEATST